MTKHFSLAPSLVASTLIHLTVLVVASTVVGQRNHFPQQNLISIALLDPIQDNKTIRPLREEATKTELPKSPPANRKRESVFAEPPLHPAVKNETTKADEIKTPPSTPLNSTLQSATSEGGGSVSGVDHRGGDIEITTGSGNAGNGAGTAIAGLGRGSGAPGLPAWIPPVRTNREAKPIQTVRASYPPMALRMGLEGDVTLRIEVDPEGKVTRAEIIKSGGAGFDEEALKAVKQSRFEPAQRDGQNVAAEFSYIYRFRLQR
jgi:periplasmic protein TonB